MRRSDLKFLYIVAIISVSLTAAGMLVSFIATGTFAFLIISIMAIFVDAAVIIALYLLTTTPRR